MKPIGGPRGVPMITKFAMHVSIFLVYTRKYTKNNSHMVEIRKLAKSSDASKGEQFFLLLPRSLAVVPM